MTVVKLVPRPFGLFLAAFWPSFGPLKSPEKVPFWDNKIKNSEKCLCPKATPDVVGCRDTYSSLVLSPYRLLLVHQRFQKAHCRIMYVVHRVRSMQGTESATRCLHTTVCCVCRLQCALYNVLGVQRAACSVRGGTLCTVRNTLCALCALCAVCGAWCTLRNVALTTSSVPKLLVTGCLLG